MKKQKHFYFPVALDDAISVLRRQCQLDKATGVALNSPVIAYMDRNKAVQAMHETTSTDQRREVCLLVAHIDERTMGNLLMGDQVHHGPCAHFVSDKVLELDHTAQAWILHDGHLSLELVIG